MEPPRKLKMTTKFQRLFLQFTLNVKMMLKLTRKVSLFARNHKKNQAKRNSLCGHKSTSLLFHDAIVFLKMLSTSGGCKYLVTCNDNYYSCTTKPTRYKMPSVSCCLWCQISACKITLACVYIHDCHFT